MDDESDDEQRDRNSGDGSFTDGTDGRNRFYLIDIPTHAAILSQGEAWGQPLIRH
jgi:hypothetical protein